MSCSIVYGFKQVDISEARPPDMAYLHGGVDKLSKLSHGQKTK